MRFDGPTIPVVIDDVKRLEKLPLTRCTYYSIEHQQPSEHLSYLRHEDMDLPIILLGFSGIVTRPTKENAFFSNAATFDSLYENVERNPEYFIDINEIWFPNLLFLDEGHTRGSIFRVGVKLFKLAYNFQQELITLKDFISFARDYVEHIEYSPSETKALESWNQEQISLIRKTYRSSEPTYRLQKKPKLARR